MPTRPVESTHDEVRLSSAGRSRATVEAEPNRPIPDPNAPGVESPSGDRMQGANGLPRRSSPDRAVARGNEDDATSGDQDIDTAGTAHDDLSPTKSM